jgi:hypothetical protein
MTAHPHERHELARMLGRACDAVQALDFVVSHKPAYLRRLAADARAGRPVAPDEISSLGCRIKELASEALQELGGAYALARVIHPEGEREEAA